MIFLHLNQRKSFREVGKILGRHHTTIKREIERNGCEGCQRSEESYLPSEATETYTRRRRKSKRGKLEDSSLRRFVIGKLIDGWSPEQIAGRLKTKAPNCYVSHETIYKFIYAKENKRLRLCDFLPRRRKRRQSLYSRRVKRSKRLRIPNRVPIEQRPEEANERTKIGHWESDLMEGKKSSKDVVSITVDRKSGYTLLAKLPNKEANHKAGSLVEQLTPLPSVLVKTLTLDNGTENYYHEKVTKQAGCGVYFCNPYHSWEKGTVENTVGLVRRYIPKGTSLDQIEQVDLNVISRQLNNRPRKRLEYYTPREVIQKETGWCI